MKQSWALTIAVLAILAVPFGIAMFEDATAEPPEPGPSEPAPADDPAPPAATAATPEEPPVASFDELATLDYTFLDLLGRRGPAIGPELSAVATLGGPRPLPEVYDLYRQTFSRAYTGVALSIDGDPRLAGGPVAAVTFHLAPSPALRDVLRRRWGSPDVVGFFGSVWLDPARRMRAALIEGSSGWLLQLSFTDPLDAMFHRRDDGSFALEPPRLLGATQPRARRMAEGDDGLLTVYVAAPPASVEPSTPITLVREDGRVVDVSIAVDLSLDPAAPAALRSILERQLGRAKAQTIGDATELRFDSSPGLSVFLYEDRAIIARRLMRR